MTPTFDDALRDLLARYKVAGIKGRLLVLVEDRLYYLSVRDQDVILEPAPESKI